MQLLKAIIFAIVEWFKKFYFQWAFYLERQLPPMERVFDFKSNDPHKNGYLPHKLELEMEHPISVAKIQKNSDSVFFVGFNSNGSVLLCSIERHKDATAEMVILLRMADGRTFVRPVNSVCVDLSSEDMFQCDGLKLTCSTPMLRWRIVFTGILKELRNDGSLSNDETFVHFGFYANNTVSSVDYRYFLDEKFASKQWTKQNFTFVPDIRRTLDQLFIHCQAMFFAGTIVINDDKHEVAFWGYKTRSILSEKNGIEHIGRLIAVTKNGLHLDLQKAMLPSKSNDLYFGHLRTPFPQETPISDISPLDIFKSGPFCERSFVVKANRLTLPVKLDVPICSTKMLRRHDGYVYEVPINISPIRIDDHSGWAIFIGNHRNQKIVQERPGVPVCLQLERDVRLTSFDSIPLVGVFDNKQSTLESVSGGKGASLAMLSNIATNIFNAFVKFSIPQGLIVTTSAYQQFCSQQQVANLIQKLESFASNCNFEKLKDVCADTINKLSEIRLPEQIVNELEQKLDQVFGSKTSTGECKFAVRSSACGEDSEETSAAGQMETYLSVQGFENICITVVKCWASQFRHSAVQYKLQHGLKFNTPMAVVVQEMVESEISGVMFTCNPTNGDPRIMTITANYGLGESVVSASVDPDTVWVHRSINQNLSIHKVNVGKKETKIVSKEDGGTIKEKVEQKQAGETCISNEQTLRLARLGLSLEDAYGSPRDIEWAFKENVIYLLQSRPITALDKETFFELLHERDSGVFNEAEVLSKANIGEVMPGSLSPLSMSGGAFLPYRRYLQETFLQMGVPRMRNPRMARSVFKCSSTHMFFGTMLNVADPNKTDYFSKSYALGIYGRENIAKEAQHCNQNKWRYIISQKFGYSKSQLFRMVPAAYSLLKQSENIVSRKEIVKFSDTDNALHNFNNILMHLPGKTVVAAHQASIMYSTIGNAINLALLASTEKGFSTRVLGDFAKLTKNCNNVVSAEIPLTLQQIAKTIESETDASDFKQLTPEAALEWIKTQSVKAKSEFQAFFERHGHRCLGEFDFAVLSWEMDPLPVIRTIQGLMSNVDVESRQEITSKQLLNSLDIQMSLFKRLIIKAFGLKLTRNGITYREKAKSALILCQHRIRVVYLRLGEQMRSEGLIPDARLVFFFELWDLYRVLTKHTRATELVTKAISRRRLWEMEGSTIYPETNPAVPKPITDKIVPDRIFEKIITGTPVSQGIVTGRACVIRKLEEANKIQKGDVLVTYATDIGWSPYYPLISGIVTELGGLISHGAVVAREYGIPCVVAMQGATSIFQTGDLVCLDGFKGILQSVKKS